MTERKFSIIIPFHNSDDTISRAIESIINQNYANLQVILVDDHSDDLSIKICTKYMEKYDYIELYKSEGYGVSSARNKGLSMITGDIITFLDSDDYYEDGILSYINRRFDEKYDAIFTGHYVVENGGKKLRIISKEIVYDKKRAIDSVLCCEEVLGSVCGKFYKRDLIAGMLFDVKFSYLEDGFFNVELLRKRDAVNVLVAQIASFNYVMHEKSATHNYDRLFDETGELKYIQPLRVLLENSDKFSFEIRSIKYAIYRLAIGNIGYSQNAIQYRKLYIYIVKYIFPFFVHNITKNKKYKIKMTLRGIKKIAQGINNF